MNDDTRTERQKEQQRGLVLFWIMFVSLALVLVGWVGYHLNVATAGEETQVTWVELYGKGFPVWRQWLEWIYAGLAGALLYALVSVAHWYHQPRAQFRDFSLWYLSTILKGPVLAFIILLFLTTVDIEVAGLSIDFKALNEAALLVAAFLLGFYNRVAREMLNQITKSIFGKAYGRAEEQFSIVPGSSEVLFEKNQSFKLSRAVDVTWLASLGKIDDAGLYTAPASSAQLTSGSVDKITAVPKDDNIPRATAVVILRSFQILGDTRLTYGGSTTYTVSSGKAVNWSVTNGTIDAAGKFTAPAKADVPGLDSVIITAADASNANDLATVKVYLND